MNSKHSIIHFVMCVCVYFVIGIWWNCLHFSFHHWQQTYFHWLVWNVSSIFASLFYNLPTTENVFFFCMYIIRNLRNLFDTHIRCNNHKNIMALCNVDRQEEVCTNVVLCVNYVKYNRLFTGWMASHIHTYTCTCVCAALI